jgi:methylglutamate dehydrogenase subunit D
MLEARSPFPDGARYDREGLLIAPAQDFTLTQMAGSKRSLERVLSAKLTFGQASEANGRVLLQVSASQVWCVGEPPSTGDLYVTPLSSGRARIAISGARSRSLLAACAPIDFHPAVFGEGHYAMTGIHHTPVLIHCVKPDTFHLYPMRTFALSVWEWLVDAAEGL